jgi:ribosomal protein S27AE
VIRPPKRRPRAYNRAYQLARERLLASNPPCAWCGAPATTADHDPPVAEAGPHLNLVPACARCNFGRVRKDRTSPSRAW